MALTVGVQTIMDAREVVLVVTGQNKALALSQMIEGGVNHMVSSECTLFTCHLGTEGAESDQRHHDKWWRARSCWTDDDTCILGDDH